MYLRYVLCKSQLPWRITECGSMIMLRAPFNNSPTYIYQFALPCERNCRVISCGFRRSCSFLGGDVPWPRPPASLRGEWPWNA